MQIGELLNRLQKPRRLSGGEYQACCPAHEDKNPSLSLKQEADRILVKCHAGCSTEAIVSALGLEIKDLFITEDKPIAVATKASGQIVATYDYKDETGKVLFQTVRYEPKDFRQRHKNGGADWVWNLEGIRRVLYHLPELKLTKAGDTVYLVEGEKDADRLWEYGLAATTSPMGAGKWREEYAQPLMGLNIIIIPDNDPPGMAHARQVANSLTGKAASVRWIPLHGEGVKDISNWIDAGGDPSVLPLMEQDIETLFASDKPEYRFSVDTIQWDKKADGLLLTFKAENVHEERTGVHARVTIYNQHEQLSWSLLNIEKREDRSGLASAAHSGISTDVKYTKDDLRRDLDAFCAGLWDFNLSRYVPEEMAGDEIPRPIVYLLKPFILNDGGTIIFAPPGRGKSFTALLWAVSIDAGCQTFWPVSQRKVLFINLERSADSLKRRLSVINKVLGLPPTRTLLTLNARGKSLNDVLAACRKAIAKNNVGMVVLDSISRAGLGDLNENQSGNRIIDSLSALCPTWLALGHTSRASEEHLFGSIMQDAGADICVNLSTQVKDDGTLGIGWQISKQNDTGYHSQMIFALEFDENGLTLVRKAKPSEFPMVEGHAPTDMETTIIDWITNEDSGDATASELAEEFGFDRANVSKMLNHSEKFVKTRKVGKSQYYGVKR